MREIKFRAWDTVTEDMLYHDEDCDRSLMLCFGGSVFSDDGECRDYRFKLMQFTGLLDKNDKEIYEGDIVKYVFGGEEFQHPVGWADYSWNIDDYVAEACEVIGNIFTNPELLTHKLLNK